MRGVGQGGRTVGTAGGGRRLRRRRGARTQAARAGRGFLGGPTVASGRGGELAQEGQHVLGMTAERMYLKKMGGGLPSATRLVVARTSSSALVVVGGLVGSVSCEGVVGAESGDVVVRQWTGDTRGWPG